MSAVTPTVGGMTTVVVLPSVLGLRQGVLDAATLLREHGHVVHVLHPTGVPVDDDYTAAVARIEALDHAAVLAATIEQARSVPGPFAVLGFSHGVLLAEHLATSRPQDVRGAVLLGGAIPVEHLGAPWPPGVPVLVHETVDDPWRDAGFAEQLAADVEAAGGRAEVLHHPGSGHLFTDASLPAEYQPVEARVTWDRVLAFLAGLEV